MYERKLIVFVKAPRPGTVKTRLAETLGAEQACAAYRLLVETLLARIDPLRHSDWDRELRFAPDDAGEELGLWLGPRTGWRMAPQGSGDLGARLERAFADGCRTARRVIVIGSDCPEIAPEDLEEADLRLQTQDMVLGPARDGGYWLIGLRANRPALFCAMEWSTHRVLEMTLHRARTAGLDVHLLRTLSDVDTHAEWTSFVSRSCERTVGNA